MEFVTTGEPTRLEQVNVGECFTFETGSGRSIGIMVAYPQSPLTSVLVLRGGEGVPSVLGQREPKPAIVFKQALRILTGTVPDQIRNGMANPKPGQVIVTPEDQYLGFLEHHGDPIVVSIKTGRIFAQPINGPVAVFDAWRVAIDGAEGSGAIFNFGPASASKPA
jgi:hypothetical protein